MMTNFVEAPLKQSWMSSSRAGRCKDGLDVWISGGDESCRCRSEAQGLRLEAKMLLTAEGDEGIGAHGCHFGSDMPKIIWDCWGSEETRRLHEGLLKMMSLKKRSL